MTKPASRRASLCLSPRGKWNLKLKLYWTTPSLLRLCTRRKEALHCAAQCSTADYCSTEDPLPSFPCSLPLVAVWCQLSLALEGVPVSLEPVIRNSGTTRAEEDPRDEREEKQQ